MFSCTDQQDVLTLSTLSDEVVETATEVNSFDYVGKLHNQYARHLIGNHRSELRASISTPKAYIDLVNTIYNDDFGLDVDLSILINKETGVFHGSHTPDLTKSNTTTLDSVYLDASQYEPYDYVDWHPIVDAKVQKITANPGHYVAANEILEQLAILKNSTELWSEQYASDNGITLHTARSSGGYGLPNWACVWDAAYEDSFGYSHHDICGAVGEFEDRVSCTTVYSLLAYDVCVY